MDRKYATVVVAAGHGVIRSGVSKLVEIVDEAARLPMISSVMMQVRLAAIGPTALVVNDRFGIQVLAALADRELAGDFRLARQATRRGAADAVAAALPALRRCGAEAFLVVFGDMPLWRAATLRSLVALHRERRPPIAMVSVAVDGAPTPAILERYGRVLRGPDGAIVGVVEPGDATPEQLSRTTSVNPSLYVFDREWFEERWARIPPYPRRDGFGEELHLPPLIAMAHAEDADIAEMPLGNPEEALGVNTLEELIGVRAFFRTRRIADMPFSSV